MSYINDTQMSEVRFSVNVSSLCSDDGRSYDACVSVVVTDPQYIPEYSQVDRFVRNYVDLPCRPDYLVSSLFDSIVDQVKRCNHIVVTCRMNMGNFENVFVRERDFKLKKVM